MLGTTVGVGVGVGVGVTTFIVVVATPLPPVAVDSSNFKTCKPRLHPLKTKLVMALNVMVYSVVPLSFVPPPPPQVVPSRTLSGYAILKDVPAGDRFDAVTLVVANWLMVTGADRLPLGVGVGVGVGVGGGGGTSSLLELTDAQTSSSSQPVTLAMYHLSRVTLLNDTLPGFGLVVLL